MHIMRLSLVPHNLGVPDVVYCECHSKGANGRASPSSEGKKIQGGAHYKHMLQRSTPWNTALSFSDVHKQSQAPALVDSVNYNS